MGGAGGGLRGMLRAEIMDTARDQFLVDVWIIFLTRGYLLRTSDMKSKICSYEILSNGQSKAMQRAIDP